MSARQTESGRSPDAVCGTDDASRRLRRIVMHARASGRSRRSAHPPLRFTPEPGFWSFAIGVFERVPRNCFESWRTAVILR
jgi:hypothetical protein